MPGLSAPPVGPAWEAPLKWTDVNWWGGSASAANRDWGPGPPGTGQQKATSPPTPSLELSLGHQWTRRPALPSAPPAPLGRGWSKSGEGSPSYWPAGAWGMASPACGSRCGCAGSSCGSPSHPLGCRCPRARSPTRPHRSCHSSARAGSQQPRSPGHWVTRPLPPRLLDTLSIHSCHQSDTVVTTQRSHPPTGTLSWGQRPAESWEGVSHCGEKGGRQAVGAGPQQGPGGVPAQWTAGSVGHGLPPAGGAVPRHSSASRHSCTST